MHWFKRVGIFFIPRTVWGWLILLAAIAYSIFTFIKIDSKSHSASDTLRPFFFYLLIIGAIYTCIAFLTSQSTEEQ